MTAWFLRLGLSRLAFFALLIVAWYQTLGSVVMVAVVSTAAMLIERRALLAQVSERA